ncbi:MAG TPA: MogA/MoaB family molybdenum cofactor biosynthesis protein [Vicinamibacterales bacterium]|nr:MogA/MoaB family molybdenum cofactor biosynthesis protein [Vicinamibacterales bacterium]
MSVAEHRAASTAHVACFVLTVSDSRTLENDTSGQAITALLEGAGHSVTARRTVKDEPAEVARILREQIAARAARVLITTGGTGISGRDSTYEAVTALFDKRIDGFGELFRMLSFEAIGPAAMLSRATAGVAGGCAIFVLPGSEHAVRLAMERLILPELGHVVRELTRHEGQQRRTEG